MSGRLIILPKKSWHPGKRENIEKVLRDERLAAEEAAVAHERAREIAQEGIVETLTKRLSADKKGGQRQAAEAPVGRKRKRRREAEKDAEAQGGKGQGWGATLQHVNLFSEAEREADKQLGQNADHQREKQEQDLKAQQRSGLAPTPLGEGAAELKDKDSQPWYTQVKAPSAGAEGGVRAIRLGREVTGQEAAGVIKRDEGRKGRADPMGSLFRSGTQPTGNLSAGKVADRLGPSDGRCFDSATREGDGSNIHNSRKKTHKKEHKHKKHKKHKRKRSRGLSATKSERDGGVDGGGSSAGDVNLRDCSETTADGTREQKLEKLRRRRLAREGGERDRQIHLLAERQMAGQSLPDERTMAYNNQYHASAARQNKIH